MPLVLFGNQLNALNEHINNQKHTYNDVFEKVLGSIFHINETVFFLNCPLCVKYFQKM